MPFGDGTGPLGQGPQRRKGMGRGRGRGQDNPTGPSGYCICPVCGVKSRHQVGIPCSEMSCTNCGTRMTRE